MYGDMMDTIGFLGSQDLELAMAMQRELLRQRRNIELIASENIVSPAVMAAMGSVLTNKYAEGYPAHRYYGGCAYVDEVENLAIRRACELFGAEFANVQPHSGAQANLAVYFALLELGDTILGMDLAAGGHLTHGSPVNMSGKNYNFVSYGVDENGYVDYEALRRQALTVRPKMIVAGASAYPRALRFDTLAEIAREAGAVVKRVHAANLRGMCGTEGNQGVAAWAAREDYVSLDDLLAEAARRGEPPFLLLADGVEDPHNLGAIIRTALLCGAHGVVIPRRGGVPVTPTVLKSSAGAAARLPVARVANIGEAVRRLKAQNVFVYCADMDGRPAFQQNLTGPIALVAGSEGSGVSPLVKSLCDGVLSLPMAGGGTGVDSFNVSVATGIILYEIMRQRGTEGSI